MGEGRPAYSAAPNTTITLAERASSVWAWRKIWAQVRANQATTHATSRAAIQAAGCLRQARSADSALILRQKTWKFPDWEWRLRAEPSSGRRNRSGPRWWRLLRA